jgi:cytosine/adenosine deaminase-related metal-dependent hydrolase
MTNEAATAALLRYNADRSEQKMRDVQTALAKLSEDPGQPNNKSVVARRAGVSREFINSHPELGRLIETAARQARHVPLPQHHDDTTIRGLQAQNRTFAQQISQQKALIAELRSTIEELRRQRQLHLGAQLMGSAVDPSTHAQLQLDHDRLAAANAALQRRLHEQDRLIAVLQEDLAASRQAHADDIGRLTADTTSPVALIRNCDTDNAAHDRRQRSR